MKIGVISDSHLSDVTPEFVDAVEKYFGDADVVIHAGDIVGYPVYSYLEQFSLRAVAGNMDSPVLKEILDYRIKFRVGNFKVGVAHGFGIPHPIEKNIQIEFPDADIIVYGHTHKPLIKKLSEGKLIFNPGSFKGNKPEYPPSLGLIELNGESDIKGKIIYLTG